MEQQKVYLKTIEEVSDALAAGKIVYNKFKTSFRKDKNGFLVSNGKDKTISLNTAIYIPQDTPLYVLEPKPLEVKLCHLYENKNGENVLIFEKFPSKNLRGVNFSTKDTGHFASNGTCLNEWGCDLVKEIADLSQYFVKK